MSEQEYGDVEGWELKEDTESALKVAQNIKQFFKIAVDCGPIDTDAKCIGKKYSYLNSVATIDYRKEAYKYKFSLKDGTSIMVQPIGNSGALQFNIDINGVSNPNVMGKDIFIFQYTRSLPDGCSENSV